VITLSSISGQFVKGRNYQPPELNIDLLRKYYLSDKSDIARRMNSISAAEGFERKRSHSADLHKADKNN
jgi:hypothetical protein